MHTFRKLLSTLMICVAVSPATPVHAAPGGLDPAFGSAGTLAAHIGCNLPTYQTITIPLVRDAQGFLYLIGFCTAPTPPKIGNQPPSQIEVLKLDATGARVTAFGDAGVAIINTSDVDSATAATIDANGDIYIVGQSEGLAGSVWKVDGASGELVDSFGSDGVVTMSSTGSVNYPNAVLLDGDGNLYVAGENVYLNYTFAISKLDTNGNFIAEFGDGGTATYSPGGQTISAVNAVVSDGAGHLYLAGESEPSDGSGYYSFALAKIDATTGATITGFGSDGSEILNLGNDNDAIAQAVALDGAGNLYVAGSRYVAIGADSALGHAAVVKVSAATGATVSGFGTEGLKTIDLTNGGSAANALVVDAMDDLYVAGVQANAEAFDMLVSKIDSSGNLVAGFGTNGSVSIDITGFDDATSALLDGNGHAYVAGVSENTSGDGDTAERVYLAARLFTDNNVSTTTLSSSLNPAAAGKTVTFTAIVTGSGATPSGKVTFSDGSIVICANVTLSSGHATCVTSTLAASTTPHPVSAYYSGDVNNLGSVSAVIEQMILGDEVFKNGFE